VSWAARLALLLVRAYQLLLGPIAGGGCRFEPTCSTYAAEAFTRHGVGRGFVLTVGRLLRCHPFARPGIDPVPPRARL
jgi:putative membrane protein insertion efficiency factor